MPDCHWDGRPLMPWEKAAMAMASVEAASTTVVATTRRRRRRKSMAGDEGDGKVEDLVVFLVVGRITRRGIGANWEQLEFMAAYF